MESTAINFHVIVYNIVPHYCTGQMIQHNTSQFGVFGTFWETTDRRQSETQHTHNAHTLQRIVVSGEDHEIYGFG